MPELTPINDVLLHALAQDGDRYVFGHEVKMSDHDPDVFDCSELVQWACHRAGVQPVMPDGSWYQARHCRNHNKTIPVAEAIATEGALLFYFRGDPFAGGRPASAHVAFSLGNGTTIEARGTRWGVGTWSVQGRNWSHGGLIPGVDYQKRPKLGAAVRDLVSTVVDANSKKLWAWTVFESGVVVAHNGAPEPLTQMPQNLNHPITDAVIADGHMLLFSRGDAGTFRLAFHSPIY